MMTLSGWRAFDQCLATSSNEFSLSRVKQSIQPDHSESLYVVARIALQTRRMFLSHLPRIIIILPAVLADPIHKSLTTAMLVVTFAMRTKLEALH